MPGDKRSPNSSSNLKQRLNVDFALQAAGLGIWEMDTSRMMINWDDRCRKLFGIAKNNPLTYEEAIQYIHPDDRERVDQAVRRVIAPTSDGQYDMTYRTIGADDGLLRWVRFTGTVYFNSAGGRDRFAGVAQDVTSQVLARLQLEQSETRLDLVSNSVPAMIFYLDQQQRYQSYNQAFREWFSVDATEAIGKTVQAFIGEAAYRRTEPNLARAYGGQQVRYQMKAPTRLDESRWLDIVYTPHLDSEGSVLGVVVLATDITQQIRAQQTIEASETRYRHLSEQLNEQVQQRTAELKTANDQLLTVNQDFRVANQALSTANHDLRRSNDNLQQFAYVASHDLQEPLRKIQTFSSLLGQRLAEQADEQTSDYLNRITKAGARMSSLIRDLLNYSRIATRQQAYGPLALDALLDTVLETLSLEIDQRGAQIQVAPLPVVNGDGSQLSQLFQNLLSNALKFTPPERAPQVRIDYCKRQPVEIPDGVRPSRLASFYHQISVSDQGVGFDMKYLDRIFQVFQRLHGKDEFPGTGVGLAICQRVVENHGGSITACSQPGEGATFSVYLPA